MSLYVNMKLQLHLNYSFVVFALMLSSALNSLALKFMKDLEWLGFEARIWGFLEDFEGFYL